jgi:hypothetical protein
VPPEAIAGRRAEHAGAGCLLSGPDEGRDADYMRDHHGRHDLAGKTDRLRQTDEGID